MDLAQALGATAQRPTRATLANGRVIEVATMVRRDQRAQTDLPRTAPGWAAGKVAVEFDGAPTWPELAVVGLLEKAGWEARWVRAWGRPDATRDALRALDDPRPVTGAGLRALDAIHAGMPGLTGAGTWDVVAWRRDEVLFIAVRRARGADALGPAQVAFLGAAIGLAYSPANFSIVSFDIAAGRASARDAATAIVPGAPVAAGEPADPPVAPPAPRTTRAPRGSARVSTSNPELEQLLAQAFAADATTRIEFRDRIAAHGKPAVAAMERWVAQGGSPGFAITVLETIGRAEGRVAVSAVLNRLKVAMPEWASMAEGTMTRLAPVRRPRS